MVVVVVVYDYAFHSKIGYTLVNAYNIAVRENSLYGVLLLLPMESTTPYME